MFVPYLASGMKEADDFTRRRVDRTYVAPFPQIASNTCICEVVRVRTSAVLTADDVVNLVRGVCVVLMKQTILAAVSRSGSHKPPQCLAQIMAQDAVAPALWP